MSCLVLSFSLPCLVDRCLAHRRADTRVTYILSKYTDEFPRTLGRTYGSVVQCIVHTMPKSRICTQKCHVDSLKLVMAADQGSPPLLSTGCAISLESTHLCANLCTYCFIFYIPIYICIYPCIYPSEQAGRMSRTPSGSTGHSRQWRLQFLCLILMS